MDAIDEKFKEKEVESYMDPDKRWINYGLPKHSEKAAAEDEGDAIVGARAGQLATSFVSARLSLE